MTADDLSTPLGQTPKRKRPERKLPRAVPKAIAGMLMLCLVAFALWALIVDDPYGGEPMVVVSADVRAPPSGEKPADNGGPTAIPAAGTHDENTKSPPGTQTINIIDGTSGQRKEVILPATKAALSSENATEPPLADQRIIETSSHGPIPRIAADGARAAEVYAQPSKSALAKSGPRIVIVLSGLGISAATTTDALADLPAAVTFALVPYASDLEKWAGRARAKGHEILLQVPMEPFDYPDNDPGPQTLLTSLASEQNVDRLHWFMSRVQGYVGIANYMGARFTANEAALGPVMRDTAKRGLIYFDDSTSQRSVAGQIAGANNAAFAKADVVLDAVPTPTAIDGALARLEALSRERGVAVGVAKISPAAIERIGKWTKGAEARGIVLVPVSMVANKPKST